MKNLIFDLGAVLLELSVERSNAKFTALLGQDIDFWKVFQENRNVFLAYETGRLSTPGFLAALHAMAPRPFADADFIDAWNSMVSHLPAHRLSWLQSLRSRYRTFLLSNTNALHMEWLDRHLRDAHDSSLAAFRKLFEKAYLSFEIHRRKPDADIYEYVLADAGINPADTLFIDDRPENIEAAERLGIQGLLHDPAREVVEAVERWFGIKTEKQKTREM